MQNRKVIVWGHKNSGNTFNYINSSYLKAFKYLGYESYWFDDNENVSGFNFDNCIFFTEDQVQKNIPLNKTSKYILHHCNLDKYIQSNLDYICLGNYVKSCNSGIDKLYNINNTLVKIDECCFWDEKTRTIHQPWATDLTPDEIDPNNAIKYNPDENDVYYVGTLHDNLNQIRQFANAVSSYGKRFINCRTNTDNENLILIRKSYVSIDIRGDWHVECGYLPCRIFKNISYGRLTGTNSEHVKDIFGEHVIYDPDPSLLFSKMVEAEQNKTVNDIMEAMLFVKNYHTYVQRVQNIMRVV